jgi:hypothetical protein
MRSEELGVRNWEGAGESEQLAGKSEELGVKSEQLAVKSGGFGVSRGVSLTNIRNLSF